MGDHITAEERAAIDAALARRTIIPPPVDGRSRAKAERQDIVRIRAASGESARTIANSLNVHIQTIYADFKALGIKLGRGTRDDSVSRAKAAKGKVKAASIRDRRRFMTTPVPMGEPQVMADADALMKTVQPTGCRYQSHLKTNPHLRDLALLSRYTSHVE